MDRKITHIIIEIDKFKKGASELQSDLDKFIYIMKKVDKIKDLEELPKTLTEDWIEQALKKWIKANLLLSKDFSLR